MKRIGSGLHGDDSPCPALQSNEGAYQELPRSSKKGRQETVGCFEKGVEGKGGKTRKMAKLTGMGENGGIKKGRK